MRTRNAAAGRSFGVWRRAGWVVGGVLIVGVVGMSGCAEDPVSVTRSKDAEVLAALPAGIHPILWIPEINAAARTHRREVRLYLWPQGVDDRVAAFQGEIRMAQGLQALDVSFPEGVLGAWNVVEPGRLRFAGVALEGVGSGAALLLRLGPGPALSSEVFQVTVERVAAAGTLADLTSRVVRREHPVVVRDRPEALRALLSRVK